MILFLWIFILVAAEEPLHLTNKEIDSSFEKIQKTKKIPEKALQMAFEFYKKNRSGIVNSSCIDQKGYVIRKQDPTLNRVHLKKGILNDHCLCIIDYTKSKELERGHCIFLEKQKDPIIESFLVAHGSGSAEKNGRPTVFTNRLSSTGTTLSGFHLTAPKTYGFSGKSVKHGAYSSMGLGLYGVEDYNWTASAVGKVTHGAPYVSKNFVGRSHGCPAMTVEKAQKILPRCAGQALWLNYTSDMAAQSSVEPHFCKK